MEFFNKFNDIGDAQCRNEGYKAINMVRIKFQGKYFYTKKIQGNIPF